MPGTLLIRADASTQMGTGHVMRCLALAQGFQDAGGHVFFVTATEAPALVARLTAEQLEVAHLSAPPGSAEDARETADLARQRNAAWIVVDGYHFDTDYRQAIRSTGSCLLSIDDHQHADHGGADLILNQNVYASEALYADRKAPTRLLLGTRYVLLRREFLEWRGWERSIPEVARNVLVTLGGSDPANVTLRVIEALGQLESPELQAKVVVGPGNAHRDALRQEIERCTSAAQLLPAVTQMPELMAWADVGIAAGGTTCWEFLYMGLPALVLRLADNQRGNAQRLGEIGAAVDLGESADLSAAAIARELRRLLAARDTRVEMSQRGRELVDGEGVRRVLTHLQQAPLRLRKVQAEDCKRIWEWANDPDVRQVSFSSREIPWEEHVRWFDARLKDANCVFYIATDPTGVPLGQVRYDTNGDEAVVSINLDGRFRGKGYGSQLLCLSSRELFDVSPVNVIHAYVKPANRVSAAAFRKAGFREVETTTIRGQYAIHLMLRKGE